VTSIAALGLGFGREAMDRVANYYRFDGGTWPQRAARAEAVVVNGAVRSIRIIDGGVGYTAVPTVSIPGFDPVPATPQVVFSSAFETNGRIGSISLG